MEQHVVLEMRGVSKEFPGVRALDNMQMKIYAGEIHALMGENGAGKSTLMNILSGILKMDAGAIFVDGQPVDIKGIKTSTDLGISMIHQELNYVPALTVADNVFLGNELIGPISWVRNSEMKEKAKELLSKLGVSVSVSAKMNELGVAQQQMVEISKAISHNSKVIIMDEPTSAITSEEVRILFRVINELKDKGVAIIYISHKMEEIFEIADRVTVMRDGKYIDCKETKELSHGDLISMMVGRQISELFPKKNVASNVELLRVEHLYGEKFSDISFVLHRGEILGFAGLMGAGRTEIMRAIFGLDPVYSGKIFIEGVQLKIRNTNNAISQGVGYVSEDRKAMGLILGMSVKENTTISCLKKYCRHNWILRRKETEVAKKLVEDFSIKTPSINQNVVNLSGGNQQKVVLAKTLLSQPEVIILDEPTRGIDVGAKVEIHKMISDLASKGKGIILISSEMPEVLSMSHRIVVINEGQKKGELSRADVTQENIMSMILLKKGSEG